MRISDALHHAPIVSTDFSIQDRSEVSLSGIEMSLSRDKILRIPCESHKNGGKLLTFVALGDAKLGNRLIRWPDWSLYTVLGRRDRIEIHQLDSSEPGRG